MFAVNLPVLSVQNGANDAGGQCNKENQAIVNDANVIRDGNNNVEGKSARKDCPMEIVDVKTIAEQCENLNFSNIKVTVGIDEDLQMILDLDPSIVDMGVDVIGCTPATISPCHTPKTIGLPPIMGG